MAALIFDTLRFSKQLKTAGVPAAQAEAETNVLAELFETHLKDLATKEDLFITKESLQHEMKDLRHEVKDLRNEMKGLRHEIRNEINSLRKDMDAKLEKLDIRFSGEMTLIKWMFGAMVAGIIGILTKLFF